MRRNGIAALGGLLLSLGGCDEATAPPADGWSEMRVTVSGDASGAARSAYGTAESSGGTSGRIEVEARVYVATRGGEWVEVTRGAARQTVQASGSDGARLLARAEVRARTYERVRVEFERVEADAGAAVEIGVGGLSGSVRVTGESDGRVVVERELAMEARSGAVASLEIDLNADQWLGRADSRTRTVSEAEFRGALQISSR